MVQIKLKMARAVSVPSFKVYKKEAIKSRVDKRRFTTKDTRRIYVSIRRAHGSVPVSDQLLFGRALPCASRDKNISGTVLLRLHHNSILRFVTGA
jgi:hypothetical protein